MTAITQLGPHGLPMRHYGSFAGRAGGARPLGRVTQLGPHGSPMRHYASFAGRTSLSFRTVRLINESLGASHIAGETLE